MDFEKLHSQISKVPEKWTVTDVSTWLDFIGLSNLKDAFRDASIDGSNIYLLEDEELKSELNINSIIVRKKILNWTSKGLREFSKFLEVGAEGSLPCNRNGKHKYLNVDNATRSEQLPQNIQHQQLNNQSHHAININAISSKGIRKNNISNLSSFNTNKENILESNNAHQLAQKNQKQINQRGAQNNEQLLNRTNSNPHMMDYQQDHMVTANLQTYNALPADNITGNHNHHDHNQIISEEDENEASQQQQQNQQYNQQKDNNNNDNNNIYIINNNDQLLTMTIDEEEQGIEKLQLQAQQIQQAHHIQFAGSNQIIPNNHHRSRQQPSNEAAGLQNQIQQLQQIQQIQQIPQPQQAIKQNQKSKANKPPTELNGANVVTTTVIENELIIQPSDGAQTTFYCINSGGGKIGRHSTNQMVILEESVSRFHAEIICKSQPQQQFYLKDIGSTTGTFIKICRAPMGLEKGMVIEMGSNQFQVTSLTTSQHQQQLHHANANNTDGLITDSENEESSSKTNSTQQQVQVQVQQQAQSQQHLHLTLTIIDGPNAPATFNFNFKNNNEKLSVGRKNTNQIHYLEDQTLSNVHSHIFVKDGRLYVEDMSSTNGTWLRLSKEGEQSEPYPLMSKAVFKVGTTSTFVVQVQQKSMPLNQLQDTDSKTDCIICCEAERDALYMPCRHNAACIKCSKNLIKCPICKIKIEELVKIYKS